VQDQANIGSHTFENSIAFADFDYELFTLPKFNSRLAPEKLVTTCPAPIGSRIRGCFIMSPGKESCEVPSSTPGPSAGTSVFFES